LRELAVRELVYCDTDDEQVPTDPDELQCSQSMWRKFCVERTILICQLTGNSRLER